MFGIGPLGVLVLLGLLLAACGSPQATPTSAPTAVPTVSDPSDERAAWEIEWEQLIADAQAEGELVVAAGGSVTRINRPLFDEFGRKFGIEITMGGGSGSAVRERMIAEQAAEQYLVDIVGVGGQSVPDVLVPAGALDPIEPLLFLPEVTDTSNWWQNAFQWNDYPTQQYSLIHSVSADPAVVAVNTDLVNPDDIQSYWDILDPKYDGLVGTLTIGHRNASENIFEFLHPDLGEDYLGQFYRKATLINERDLLVDQLGMGSLGIVLWISTAFEQVRELAAVGAPVATIDRPLQEGGALSAGGSRQNISVAKNPLHPNATKLFMNWFLSQEGQLFRQEMDPTLESLRTDIPKDMVEPIHRMQPGVEYVITNGNPVYEESTPDARAFLEGLSIELGYGPIEAWQE